MIVATIALFIVICSIFLLSAAHNFYVASNRSGAPLVQETPHFCLIEDGLNSHCLLKCLGICRRNGIFSAYDQRAANVVRVCTQPLRR